MMLRIIVYATTVAGAGYKLMDHEQCTKMFEKDIAEQMKMFGVSKPFDSDTDFAAVCADGPCAEYEGKKKSHVPHYMDENVMVKHGTDYDKHYIRMTYAIDEVTKKMTCWMLEDSSLNGEPEVKTGTVTLPEGCYKVYEFCNPHGLWENSDLSNCEAGDDVAEDLEGNSVAHVVAAAAGLVAAILAL